MDSLWIDFVNSDYHDYRGGGRHEDRLEQPQWLRSFADTWDLGRVDLRKPRAQAALKELRSLLQRFVRTLVRGRRPSARDIAALNQYLAGQPLVSRLERRQGSFAVTLVATTGGLSGVLSAIARSFAAFLAEGDPRRLKTCENPDCRWVFYDQTRSRTRRWCEVGCGNLVKVRQFRARQRGRAGRRP